MKHIKYKSIEAADHNLQHTQAEPIEGTHCGQNQSQWWAQNMWMLRASASLILTSTRIIIIIIIIIGSSILQRILKTQIDLHHHPSIGKSSSGINPSLLLFLVVGYCWCYAAHSRSVQQHSKAWYKLKGRGQEMQDWYGVVSKLFSPEYSRRRGRSSSSSSRRRRRRNISSSKRRSKNSRSSSSSRRSKKENKYKMVFAGVLTHAGWMPEMDEELLGHSFFTVQQAIVDPGCMISCCSDCVASSPVCNSLMCGNSTFRCSIASLSIGTPSICVAHHLTSNHCISE